MGWDNYNSVTTNTHKPHLPRLQQGYDFLVLLKCPIRGVFINVNPEESIAPAGRISGIIDKKAFMPEAFDYFGLIWISPAGSYVEYKL